MVKSPNPKQDEEYEHLEEELRPHKSDRPMPKSGRSVFDIQKQRQQKPENPATTDVQSENH